MANQLDSWRNRRWKIVENIFANKRSLKKLLLELYKNYPANNSDFDDLLINNGIPFECKRAIIMWLNHPDLERDEYLSFITPPMTYWNAEAEYMGPDHPTPATYFRNVCERIAEELGTNDFLGVDYTLLNFEALTRLFAQDGTVITFNSYMDITDARNLLTAHKDELEALLKYRSENKDKMSPPILTGRVDGVRKNHERDNLILRLANDGKKPKQIAKRLELMGYDSFTDENIRKILSRERKRNQKT